MAMVKCKECGAARSSDAPACPKCGARVRRTGIGTWLVAAFIGIPVVYGAVSSGLKDRPASPVAAARPADGEQDARVQCRMAIKAAAANPSTVEFSMPASTRKDGAWAFYWARGAGLRMQNRVGAINDAAALCVVRDGRVVKLTIDDTHVI